MDTLPGFDAERGAGIYEITVAGQLGQDWSILLQEMTIEQMSIRDDPIVVLRGRLPDQAALHGVLNTLYSLSLSIISVTRDEP